MTTNKEKIFAIVIISVMIVLVVLGYMNSKMKYGNTTWETFSPGNVFYNSPFENSLRSSYSLEEMNGELPERQTRSYMVIRDVDGSGYVFILGSDLSRVQEVNNHESTTEIKFKRTNTNNGISFNGKNFFVKVNHIESNISVKDEYGNEYKEIEITKEVENYYIKNIDNFIIQSKKEQ